MQVKASPGLQCPKEGKPREYITDDEAVSVPDGSVYYQKLIADGSLIECGSAEQLPSSAREGRGGKSKEVKDHGK